jgi:hypothetical protein
VGLLHSHVLTFTMHQTLASEYATRYLEQIGVKPSKQAMDLVHKSIPLTHENIKTTLRAKGHVSDELTVTCPKVQHSTKVSAPISSFSFAQLTLSSKGQEADSSLDIGGKKASLSQSQATLAGPAAEPGSTFRDLASKYLYPFNLSSSGPVETSHPIVTIKKEEGGDSKSSPWGGLADVGLIDGVSAHEEIAEELCQELIVTPEPILMILIPLESALVEWYKAQSADTVARLPYTDFKEGINLIGSDSTIKFYATMINLLHDRKWSRRPRSSSSCSDDDNASSFMQSLSKDQSFTMQVPSQK